MSRPATSGISTRVRVVGALVATLGFAAFGLVGANAAPAAAAEHVDLPTAPAGIQVVSVTKQANGSASVLHAQIDGSGSSWAANAVNQWVADVTSEGLQVVFTSTGSAEGRTQFTDETTDFAVSDIGYQGVDPTSGNYDTNCQINTPPSECRPFAYVPVVAGGTSFPYQVRVAGKLVTNIRLSGLTLAKIFTGAITNWADPEITADNNGRALPSLTIIPVVHSEGSGSTAQFTRYLDHGYPTLWRPFAGIAGGTPNGIEYWPPDKSGQISANGSDGVMDYISSAAANGAIGFDEYSYALGQNYPVIKLENAAGVFTAPTQYNVAVALTKAQIITTPGPDYLLQILNDVYTDPDPRTYAMSSYSYMLIPTGTNAQDSRMSTPKRQTIADFLYYSTCQGQAEVGPIGYSPLPINLVEASLAQVGLLHQTDPDVVVDNENVATCHNPTFIAGQPNVNYLAEIAPEPPECDHSGQGPCTGTEGLTNGNPGSNGKPTGTTPSQASSGGSSAGTGGSSSASGGGPSAGSGPTTTTTTTAGHTATTAAKKSGSAATTAVASSSDQAATVAQANPVPTTLSGSYSSGGAGSFAGLAALGLIAVLVLPPLINRRLSRRREGA